MSKRSDDRKDGSVHDVEILSLEDQQLWVDEPMAALVYAAGEWASGTQTIVTSLPTRTERGQIQMTRAFRSDVKPLQLAACYELNVTAYVSHIAELYVAGGDVCDVVRLVLYCDDGNRYSTFDVTVVAEILQKLRHIKDLTKNPLKIQPVFDAELEMPRLTIKFLE